ncbi:MAG: DUF2235 domain-containing protein [Oscillatoria princeps RMCB-10]|jgi:uncharacterized protein (DUF2235 family)|nr:DUF2235 domain-containing protein [Oscillatoria princeps RMCB-10]
MKRLIVCCDGTWQKLTDPYPTNVVKIAQAIKPVASDGTPQVLYYDEGVGAEEDAADRLFGGAFGKGIDQNIQDAYRFLCLNYVDGDEIYLFGFSRGAYTVRSLSGLMYNSGLLKRENIRQAPEAYQLYCHRGIPPSDQEAKDFRKENSLGSRVEITLLGCWDTVGSLGIPDLSYFGPLTQQLNNKYRFHDTQLNKKIKNALHAVAIDEQRKVFNVTPMQKHPDVPDQVLRQVWFAGDHGCVGGGTQKKSKLADGTLKWMIESCGSLGLGLEFDISKITPPLDFDCTCDFQSKSIIQNATKLAGTILREIGDEFDELHESVKLRWKQRSDYRPENLKKYRDKLEG